MKTSIDQLAKCDWEQMERDVVTRIRMLAATARNLEQNELTDKIANDLILPNLRLLGEFCACVELTDEDDGSDQIRAAGEEFLGGMGERVEED